MVVDRVARALARALRVAGATVCSSVITTDSWAIIAIICWCVCRRRCCCCCCCSCYRSLGSGGAAAAAAPPLPALRFLGNPIAFLVHSYRAKFGRKLVPILPPQSVAWCVRNQTFGFHKMCNTYIIRMLERDWRTAGFHDFFSARSRHAVSVCAQWAGRNNNTWCNFHIILAFVPATSKIDKFPIFWNILHRGCKFGRHAGVSFLLDVVLKDEDRVFAAVQKVGKSRHMRNRASQFAVVHGPAQGPIFYWSRVLFKFCSERGCVLFWHGFQKCWMFNPKVIHGFVHICFARLK